MPEFTTLSGPKGRVQIEYSCAAMQQIRQRAIDGLMALPRIGMGVGGLLLGTRREGVIRVVNSIAIPCSHAGGPSFNLTDAEKQHALELIVNAGEPPVIGWYCSKTRGTPTLAESESAIFRELFPGSEQLALMIRPSTIMPVHAAFYVRDALGRIVDGIECDLEEMSLVEGANENPACEAPIVVPETVSEKPEAVISEPLPAPPPPPPPSLAPAVSRPAPASVLLDEAPPQSRKAKARPQGWVLTVAACVALAALFFFSRDLWLPVPPLALTLTQSNGELTIHWNTDAFRGVDRASLTINDGGDLRSLSLDRTQLNRGQYIHTPASQRVTAKMSAGDRSAIAVWFAPLPKEPPPVQPAESPADPPKSPLRRAPIPDDR